MESRARLFAHPVHKMLVVFPLGLFAFALVCDAAYVVTREPSFAVVAYWDIGGGILGGVLAAVFGTMDWMAIPRGTRAKAIGLLHGLGGVAFIGLFIINWMMRVGSPGFAPSVLAVTLSFGAMALGGLTGWLGGELVNRLGVGVDAGAHLNAPSSLSGRPAHGNDDEFGATVVPALNSSRSSSA